MAHSRSARKRIRQSEQRRQRNRAAKSRLKGAARRLVEAVQTGDQQLAEQRYREAVSTFDKAAGQGLIHRRRADRKKAWLDRVKAGRPAGAAAAPASAGAPAEAKR